MSATPTKTPTAPKEAKPIPTALQISLNLVKNATGALSKIQEGIIKATGELQGILEVQEQVIGDIATQELKLEGLLGEYQEQDRKLKVDFDLEFKANKLSTVAKVLSESGNMVISQENFNELETAYNELKDNFDTKLTEEVDKLNVRLIAEKVTALKEQQLTFQATSAQSLANLDSLKAQLNMANKTILDLQNVAAANLAAQNEQAKHRGGGAPITVSTVK